MSQIFPPFQAEDLRQLSNEKLVEIILAQQAQIVQLTQEIDKLKVSFNLDTQTSSKPPSTDLLKKSEKSKATPEEKKKRTRKPGGQPGYRLSSSGSAEVFSSSARSRFLRVLSPNGQCDS